jgi:hypothetical protein
MTPFQTIPVVAAPSVDNGSVLVGVAVITLVVVAVLGAAVWASLRLRSVQPVLKKGISGLREERFAAEVLREFLPDVQHPAGAQGVLLEPAAGLSARSKAGPVLGDVVAGGAGSLRTSMPRR